MVKKYILFLSIVTFISLIFGIQIINFNSQSSIQNIIFNSSQNYTFNISLNKNANIANSYMNLSALTYVGIPSNLSLDSIFWNNYTVKTELGGGTCNSSILNESSDIISVNTFINAGGGFSSSVDTIYLTTMNYYNKNVEINFTINVSTDTPPNQAGNRFLMIEFYNNTNMTSPYKGANSSGAKTLLYFYIGPPGLSTPNTLNQVNFKVNTTNNFASLYNHDGSLNGSVNLSSLGNVEYLGFKLESSALGGTSNITLQISNWSITNYNITNPYLYINNTQIWNYSGVFNQSNNRTTNFSSTLTSALNGGLCDCSGCNLTGNNCTIPFTFHSDTAGILQISDLNITWTENIKPNMTINQPNGTYTYLLNLPININVSDNWQLSYCYFNITRGASTEVSNTPIADFHSTTFTVSSNANYVANVYCNDTSGNINTNSSNFTVNSGSGIGSSGGGGAGIIIINSGNWTMTTSGNNAIYDSNLVKGSDRVLTLYFQNFGNTLRKITLKCEDVTGNLCQYTSFEDSFDLPVLQDIKTTKDITINVPKDYENGDYEFNIYSTDDSGNKGVVTFNVNVGNFGYLTGFLVKASSSLKFGGYNIPYLLLGLLSFAVFWAVSYFILKGMKKDYSASVSFIIGIIFGILAILIV